MAQLNKTDLKAKLDNYIKTNGTKAITGPVFNDVLTDFIDSLLNGIDDVGKLGLYTYNPALTYTAGMSAVYNGVVYWCIGTTTGTFDPTKWTDLSSKAVPITQAALTTLVGAGSLVQGHGYQITDSKITVIATSNSTLSPAAVKEESIAAKGSAVLVSGTQGSVTGVTVDGDPIIPDPVPFNTDLNTTIADVVTAINGVSGDYEAYSLGGALYVKSTKENGLSSNGFVIDVLVSSDPGDDLTFDDIEALAGGGKENTTLIYDFANDKILYQEDTKGNKVSGDFNCKAFPWGQSNVKNNDLSGINPDSELSFKHIGTFENNVISGSSELSIPEVTNFSFVGNQITGGSTLEVTGEQGVISKNVIHNSAITATMNDVSGTGGALYANNFFSAEKEITIEAEQEVSGKTYSISIAGIYSKSFPISAAELAVLFDTPFEMDFEAPDMMVNPISMIFEVTGGSTPYTGGYILIVMSDNSEVDFAKTHGFISNVLALSGLNSEKLAQNGGIADNFPILLRNGKLFLKSYLGANPSGGDLEGIIHVDYNLK